ncbi:MAG: PP2C family serine/threonine-protein phosphatase [Patescibacteria group bacterium]
MIRLVDPYRVKASKPKTKVIIASSTRQGTALRQEDAVQIFEDECVVISDGLSASLHGDIASKIAAETALWAYKHIRLHPSFWVDKKLFMKRIFRSSNLAVWQKLREKECEGGAQTTLTVAIVGPMNVWIGQAGDTGVFLYREGNMKQVTSFDRTPDGLPKHTLGEKRLGLVHEFRSEEFLPHDVLILLSDGAWEHMNNTILKSAAQNTGGSQASLSTAAEVLLDAVMKRGGKSNMSIVLIKKLPAS